MKIKAALLTSSSQGQSAGRHWGKAAASPRVLCLYVRDNPVGHHAAQQAFFLAVVPGHWGLWWSLHAH